MNWTEFLNDHLIDYVTGGKNTSRGWLSINCPFCEGSDPSHHMGIHISSGKWSCWRDASHSGSKPEYLISRLIGVSKAQAIALLQAYTGVQLSDFDTLQAPTGAQQASFEPIKPVPWPHEFEPCTPIYVDYIKERGFEKPKSFISYYNIECCQVGRWKQRLIIPILDSKRNILGWQGRAIVKPKIAPRYLTSHQQVKRTIYNLQNMNKGGRILFICEGPFDALKIDWYGKPLFRATCTFGTVFTLDQINEISKLSSKFDQVISLYDNDYSGISGGFQLNDWLPNVKLSLTLPGHDPGSLSRAQIEGLFQCWGG